MLEYNIIIENVLNINLKYFLSKIELLKNTSNYKNKGPYIYCAVKRRLNIKGSTILLPIYIIQEYLNAQKNY